MSHVSKKLGGCGVAAITEASKQIYEAVITFCHAAQRQGPGEVRDFCVPSAWRTEVDY